tara:strand:+ start:695 stop:1276 length:582 start_codon:yes stop_codon:yes gene_type:complete
MSDAKKVSKKDNMSMKTLELDHHWHLATNEHEIAITELEHSLIRSYEGFTRWTRECVVASSGFNMSTHECAILNIIAMHDRPKSTTEITRLLNRDDKSNIQYSIGKLTSYKLVEKTSTDHRRKGVRYRTTIAGNRVVKRYVSLRKELLIELTETIRSMDGQLAAGSKILDLMSGMYDQAARIAAIHRTTFEKE